MTNYFVIALAILAWLLAAYFAFDWYRMRRQRDFWKQTCREQDSLKAISAFWWQDYSAPHTQPRDELGRFIKRGK